MAQVQAEKRNISVNVISERFHPRIQATIDTCGLLMMLLVGVLFVRYGFSFTVNSFQRGDIIEGINIPQFIFKAFFIVGGFLLMLQAVFDITDAAKHLLRK
jgi:TRAP-type mannitol/chloroaromatic compound transport system permease small subunit